MSIAWPVLVLPDLVVIHLHLRRCNLGKPYLNFNFGVVSSWSWGLFQFLFSQNGFDKSHSFSFKESLEIVLLVDPGLRAGCGVSVHGRNAFFGLSFFLNEVFLRTIAPKREYFLASFWNCSRH